MNLTVQEILEQLVAEGSFSTVQSQFLMEAILEGQYSPVQIGAILSAFHLRGVQAKELAGFVIALQKKAVPFSLPAGIRAVDNCGTGGDRSGSFNLSTAAALVASAAGVPIVKHGNRSVSSQSGSADFLEALGFPIEARPEAMLDLFQQTGFAFLFAPLYHPGLHSVLPVRRELGIRTLFNLAGPLANPAPLTDQLTGVSRRVDLTLFARTLALLGRQRMMAVWGEPGLDEISPCGKTYLFILEKGVVRETEFHPSEAGYQTSTLADLRGGSAQDNARLFHSILNGKRKPIRDAVVLNAAPLFWMTSQAEDLSAGCQRAEEVLNSGQARDFFHDLIRTCQQVLI